MSTSYKTVEKNDDPTEAKPVESEEPTCSDYVKTCPLDTKTFFVEGTKGFIQDLKDFGADLCTECIPSKRTEAERREWKALARSWIHIPYFPCLHRPGWLLRYVLGPYDAEWVENLVCDLGAGITVAMTLVPQVKKL